ncbi:hypothetical protein HZS_3783 [Henneguya salminicola]|nr:hypothetical protein HZS_3783 [Henneguya salminicola]
MQTQISWTITFYLAIFNEGKSLLFLCPTDNNSYLFSWIQTYTNKYLKLLQDFLLQQSKTITHDNFSQLIESFSQTSYCVALFDRNYIEISTSVGKIFKETLLQFYTQMSEKAKQDFRIQINSTNLQVLCNNSEFTPSKYPISVNSMLVFGPIARLYNTFITINNCYSIFPCVDIIPDLSTKLQHILEHAAEIIKNIHDKKSKEIYSNAFIFIFLPNVFQLIWKNVHSSKKISTYLGLGPIDYIQYLQNLRKCLFFLSCIMTLNFRIKSNMIFFIIILKHEIFLLHQLLLVPEKRLIQY